MKENADDFIEKARRSLLSDFPLAIILTDPNLPDKPIIYVNRAFERITGYAASYAIGRNCRFLQGKDRNQPALDDLRRALSEEKTATVELRNYRLDGTPYINRLMVSPLYETKLDGVEENTSQLDSDSKRPFAFIGIQSVVAESSRSTDVLENLLQETQHRVKNHLAMVAGLIRLQQRSSGEKSDPNELFGQLSNRVEALSLLYDEFSSAPVEREFDYDVVSAGSYVSRVVNTIGSLDGRNGIRLNIDCDTVYMPTDRAAKFGLLTSEIVSNALEHAFADRDEGYLEVRLKEHGQDSYRLTFSDDGIGLGESNWPEEGNLGAKLVRELAKSINAEMSVISSDNGTIITLDFVNSMGSAVDSTGDRKRLSTKDVTSLGDADDAPVNIE